MQKLTDEERRQIVSYTLSPVVAKYLREFDNSSQAVEQIVRDTEDFRVWESVR